MKTLKLLLPAIAAAVLCSCGGSEAFKPVHLILPEAPSMMDEGDKLVYISEHYWDDLTKSGRNYPCDSTLVSGIRRREIEEAVSTYIVILEQMPLEQAQKSVAHLADKIIACEKNNSASNVFEQVSAIVQRYFYDPNSPLRDEDLYTPFAAKMASCELVPEAKRASFAEEVEKTSLNRRGTVAADFVFCNKKGRSYSLHGIKSEYIILFFSNPGCTSCKEIIEALSGAEMVNVAIAQKVISVLNIYIDEKMDEWYEYMPIYPNTWYNGFDAYHAIRNEELYDVRAIPSLYLLDSQKKVILKDVPLERLMNILPSLLKDKITIAQ